MSKAAFTAIVSGRVQLVMYRDFAKRKARSLGIAGEVMNKRDGTVLVRAEGEKEKLDAFLALLNTGSLLANVEHVSVEWQKPGAAFKGFDIRYS